MLSLLLLAPVHASGVMYADVRLVTPKCETIELSEAEAWPAGRKIRLTGQVRGSTSAPGGPVNHHVFPLAPEHMQLTRQGCRVPEPGTFKEVGRCGADLMVRYTGTLLPGETYNFNAGGGWPQIQVAGKSKGEDCPEPPPPVVYVDERTTLSERTEAMTLPEGAVYVDTPLQRLELQSNTMAEFLGLPGLWGMTALPYAGELSLTDPATARVTRRRVRHVFDEEDGMGGVWCTTREEEEVEVALDGAEVVFTFQWDGEGERVDGRCPQL